jgi:hypothetical protein
MLKFDYKGPSLGVKQTAREVLLALRENNAPDDRKLFLGCFNPPYAGFTVEDVRQLANEILAQSKVVKRRSKNG